MLRCYLGQDLSPVQYLNRAIRIKLNVKHDPQSAGAGASNILGSCLKLTAALNGCAYVPGGYFAKLACESAAKMSITCD